MSHNLLPDGTIFYKYTSLRGILAILISQSIRLSPLDKLNDPFEVYNIKLMDFDEEEFKTKLLDKLVSYVFGEINCPHPSLFSSSRLAEWKNHYAQNPTNFHSKETVREILLPLTETFVNSYLVNADTMARKLWDQVFSEYVVFCTSTTPTDVKMLTHYADDHRGVVVAFQGLSKFDSALLASKQITYQDNPPTLHTLDEYLKQSVGEEIIDYTISGRKMVFTKHSMWTNEQEMRLAYPDQRLYSDGFKYIKIFPEEIHSIYFGCRMDELDKELVSFLVELKYPHVKLFNLVQNRIENGFSIAPII
jgi:hypothetical protein